MASRAIQRKLSASWLSSDFSNLLGVVFLLGFGGVLGCKFLEKKYRFWSSASIIFLVHQAPWWVRLRLGLSLVYDLVYDFGVPPLGRQWFCLMLSQLLDDNSGVLDRALAALEDWGC